MRKARGFRSRATLGDLLVRNPRPVYDWLYRRGAPWEGGPRAELVELVRSGRLDVGTGRRVVDLGCGSGASSVFLAEHGFDVVGVDLSPVAIDKARRAAAERGVDPRFVVADMLEPIPELTASYDVLIDGGSIDDLPRSRRPAVVDLMTSRLSHPGSVLIMWCFYARDRDLPWISLSGPSRFGAPGFEPDELTGLFERAWHIERLSGGLEQRHACFLLTRR